MNRQGQVTKRKAGVFTERKQKIRLVRRNCRLTKKELSILRQVMEFQSGFYKECFGKRRIPDVQITIFGKFDEFRLSQKSTPKYARSDFGYYDVDTGEIAIYKDSGFLETCYHEMSHRFIGGLFRMTPEWLDEGLAQYFEGAEINENGVQISSYNWQLKRIRKLIRRNRIRLKKLVRLSYKKFHKRHDLDNYAVSWGILFMLMYQGKNFVRQLIAALRSGKNSTESIDAIYPGGIEKLQNDFMTFYR